MKLAIISHTNHYKDANGTIVGWGPTVSEINQLAPHFDEIYHVATLHTSPPPPSALPYLHPNIKLVSLPPTGGASIASKFNVLAHAPKTIRVVNKTLALVDAYQLRTPTGIGVYLIPYLTWFTSKKGWYKYAGNWNQKKPPLGYRIQRWFLKNQSRKVTINGQWPQQPEHCITFENPCLTLDERAEGINVIKAKRYTQAFSYCFVGRLDDAKGVQRIIDAFSQLSDLSAVAHIHFIGNGSKMSEYESQCDARALPVTFHGFLPREKVFEIYRSCHFLMLPSTASEGFPKVIAEGMNFGCIPIVSNVSSIGQYITAKNGFVVTPTTSTMLFEVINDVVSLSQEALKERALAGYEVAARFTFENYHNRIENEILV